VLGVCGGAAEEAFLLSAGFISSLSFCNVPWFFKSGEQAVEVRLEEHLCHTKGS